MKLEKLIETNFKTVRPEDTLGDLIKVIRVSHRNIFPVIDEENNFIGIVKLDDIRDIIFNPELYDKTIVKNLMIVPEYTISINEPMEDVAGKFHKSGRFNIAVLKDGKYLGFVSRANVFSSYRKMLRHFSEH